MDREKFIDRVYDLLDAAEGGGGDIFDSPYEGEKVWGHLKESINTMD